MANKALHKAGRENELAALRSGVKVLSVRFADRKKKANKESCRKGNW